jgi:hypothetical protein
MAEHLGEPGVQLTWGDMKTWAEIHGIPDSALVVADLGTLKALNDLHALEDSEGQVTDFVCTFEK